MDLPTPVITQSTTPVYASSSDPVMPQNTGSSPTREVSQPTITAGPTLVFLGESPGLAKRTAPLPPYLTDLGNPFSQFWLLAGCSCLITSDLPVVSTTTTSTVPKWTASTV